MKWLLTVCIPDVNCGWEFVGQCLNVFVRLSVAAFQQHDIISVAELGFLFGTLTEV